MTASCHDITCVTQRFQSTEGGSRNDSPLYDPPKSRKVDTSLLVKPSTQSPFSAFLKAKCFRDASENAGLDCHINTGVKTDSIRVLNNTNFQEGRNGET